MDATADQLKAQRERVLGSELGAVYHQIWNEIVSLRWEWAECSALFATGEQVALLNDTAPAFFYLVQHAIQQHVISAIASLTDRCITAGRSNLTVRRIPALAAAVDPDFGRELAAIVAVGNATWERIREWRNKHVAHLDLEVALDRRATPLQPVTAADIDASIGTLLEILRCIERRCSPGADVRFDVIGRPGSDVLLWFLRRAQRAEAARLQRIRSGNALPEDFDRS